MVARFRSTLYLRVAGSVAFGLVPLVLMAAVAFWSTGKLGDSHNQLTKHVLPDVSAAAEVRSAAGDMHFAQTKYALDGGEGRPDYEDDRSGFVDSLAKLKKTASTPAQEAQIKKIEAAFAEFDKIDADLYTAVKAHDAEGVSKQVEAEDEAADGLVEASTAYISGAAKRETSATKEFSDARSKSETVTIVLALVALLLTALLAWRLARKIVLNLRSAVDVADRVAEGDLESTIEVRSQDELGQLAAALGRATGHLRGVAAAAEKVAAGDLTVTVEPASERDTLGRAFATMVESLRSIVSQVTEAGSDVSQASRQMATTSEDAGRAVGEIGLAVGEVASGAEQQVRSISAARALGDEIASATADGAEDARGTLDAAGEARQLAEDGAKAVARATEAMEAVRDSAAATTDAIRKLGDKSDQIGEFVETITGIAGQTNLLALNAAIEAARAGEQGRGFAGVADEVRKLAESSQQAAAEITTLVDEIKNETASAVGVVEEGAQRTDDGVATVAEARDTFERFGSSSADMEERVARIAGAIDSIAATSRQMQEDLAAVVSVAESSSASTEQVSASTQETAASTQEIAASAQQLASTASELERLVARFKLEA
jgi:methyl-accepting chemotaxis protein